MTKEFKCENTEDQLFFKHSRFFFYWAVVSEARYYIGCGQDEPVNESF